MHWLALSQQRALPATAAGVPAERRCRCACATSSTSDSSSEQRPPAYQQLPPEFWDAQRVLYNRMRHERDRANRRARLQQLRRDEEQQLAALPVQARAAYEREATALRVAAAKQQKAVLAEALVSGLRVIIDCSYCQQQQPQQEPLWQQQQQQQQQQQGSIGAAALRSRSGAECSRGVRSLAKQIELSVSVNRRSSRPVALTVTSFTGDLATWAGHLGAAAWPLNVHERHVMQLVPPPQLVLLSPDAEQPLLELDAAKAYVIGGIVDRSVRKGMTLAAAQRHGLQVARLPVAEYKEQLGLGGASASTRPVLNVTDVVVALLEFQRTGCWVTALQAALPARKQRVNTRRPRLRRGCDKMQSDEQQLQQQQQENLMHERGDHVDGAVCL